MTAELREPGTTGVGPAGPQGPPGPSGDGANFIFEQNVAAELWLIVHGLGYFPAVTTVDTLDRELLGAVEYIDTDTVEVTFAIAITGKAYLS